jgi:hypothetical protein
MELLPAAHRAAGRFVAGHVQGRQGQHAGCGVQRARSRPLLTRDSTMQPALELELALAEIFNMAATPALSDPCVGACLVAEFTATGVIRALPAICAVVSAEAARGLRAALKRSLHTPPPRRSLMTDDTFCAQLKQTSKSCATCP